MHGQDVVRLPCLRSAAGGYEVVDGLAAYMTDSPDPPVPIPCHASDVGPAGGSILCHAVPSYMSGLILVKKSSYMAPLGAPFNVR